MDGLSGFPEDEQNLKSGSDSDELIISQLQLRDV